MTPSEKGYFKKYSAKHIIGESNDYILLFDAIDKITSYTDDVLLAKPIAKRLGCKLPGVKNYLYTSILEVLRAYHSGKNQSQRIQEKLFEVRLLAERGLYEQAEKICRKAVEQSKEIENNRLYLDSLTLYSIVIAHLGQSKFFREKSIEITEHIKSSSEIVYNEYLYWVYYLRFEDNIVLKGKQVEEKNEIFNSSLMNGSVQPLSFRAWLSYMYTLSLYHSAEKDNYTKTLEISEKIVEEFEKNATRKKEFFGLYVGALHTLLTGYCQCGQYHKFEEKIECLRDAAKLFELNEYQIARAMFLYVVCEITYDATTVSKERFLSHLQMYTEYYAKYEKYSPVIYVKLFAMECGKMCLLCDEPRTALIWLQRALNNDIQIREDIHMTAEILALCAHLDIGNESYIEYGIRSLKRSKAKLLPFTKFHRSSLHLLSKLAQTKKKSEKQSYVEKFCEKHRNDPEANEVLLRFFTLWHRTTSSSKISSH